VKNLEAYIRVHIVEETTSQTFLKIKGDDPLLRGKMIAINAQDHYAGAISSISR
jgi:hypothetical protein